ncbi:MAG: hypothetical protein RI955_1899, partial [Bacteroidota bacterium]
QCNFDEKVAVNKEPSKSKIDTTIAVNKWVMGISSGEALPEGWYSISFEYRDRGDFIDYSYMSKNIDTLERARLTCLIIGIDTLETVYGFVRDDFFLQPSLNYTLIPVKEIESISYKRRGRIDAKSVLLENPKDMKAFIKKHWKKINT